MMKKTCRLVVATFLTLSLLTCASVLAQTRGSAKHKARRAAPAPSPHQVRAPRDPHSGRASGLISAPVDAHSGQKRGLVTYNGHAGLGSSARRRQARSRKAVRDNNLTDDEYWARTRTKRVR